MMTTASDDEDLHFDDEDDALLQAALEESLKDQHFSGGHQDAGTSKYSDIRESFDGFDTEAGKSWIYPTNYPLREYQFSIVQKGLFSNTLVSLPTGLGKTFIAAVIMFNFYRWYPQGKIIFMAPTKPLVAQQIEACFNVMGIPQKHMAEMTGSMNPSERKVQWKNKRMFFLTPQVMTNDISRGNCPAKLVKCLVVDEAHKSLGNHPYAVVVKEVAKVNRQFRILALSATPGSDIKAVQQIITNLLISNVEIRSEDAIDIMPYTHGRIIEKIIVPLGDHLESVKTQFMQVIMIYVERLTRRNVLWKCNPENLTKFVLLKERDKFRQNPPENLPQSEFGKVESDFATSMSLYHAYELLQVHGLRSFYNFLKGIFNADKGMPTSRFELKRNGNFRQLLEGLEASFEAPENNSRPSTSTASESTLHCGPEKPFVSHPKMQKLVEIMLEHFQRHKDESNQQDGHISAANTRAMVFSQYRDSVAEITDLLNKHEPLIKAMQFIGQGSGASSKGFTQKIQLQVVSKFRTGGFNTLVSTCVGEEGLDIGEVDLIICYDAHKNPIRLVQRMGRTGRKRKGRIIMLITKGKEERTYNQGQLNKRNIDRTIASGSQVYNLYPMNPRMVPVSIHPICNKISIVTETFQTTTMIRQKANSFQKLKKSDSAYLTEEELDVWNSKFKLPISEVCKPPLPMAMLSLKGNAMENMQKCSASRHLSLTVWLPWLNVQQRTALASHCKKTVDFVDIMQTIQVYTQLEDDNNSYGLELAPFFDKQDVLQYDEKQVTPKSHIYDFFPIVSRVLKPSGGESNLATPDKAKTPVKMPSLKKRHKLQRPLFSSDSDDDFCFTSPSRRKLAEKDISKIEGRMPKKSDIKVVSSPTTSLPNPEQHFFHLPADFTERPESLGDRTVPRVRLKTPPPSPPHDIVKFKLWLAGFSSKTSAISKQEVIEDDLFTHIDLEEWEEGASDTIVAHGPTDSAHCKTPQKGVVEVSKSALTSPVFNSSTCEKNAAENAEADSISIGQRSLFSVTQLVDMLNRDSFVDGNADSDELPSVIKLTASKYSFKRLSKNVHEDEQHTEITYIPKMPESKDSQLKPSRYEENFRNTCATEAFGKRLSSPFNSIFRFEDRSNSGLDFVPQSPAATKANVQSNSRKECLKIAVPPLVPCATLTKQSVTDSTKKSPSPVCAKPSANHSPIANFFQGGSNEPDIIPPTPRRTCELTEFKYKFKLKCSKSSEPALNLANSLCLSPIGAAASKNNESSALPERATVALAASTPVRVPSKASTIRERSSDLELDIDFIQHNRKRSRKCVISPETTNAFNTSLPKRKMTKLSLPPDNAGCQYLEVEAEVCDVDNSSDEDEDIPGIDHYEASFIDDRLHPTQFTQNKQDATSAMAMYLRTLRSPPARPGAFKLPSKETLETKAHGGSKNPIINVFSQQPSSDDSDYLNDSFCVDNDFVEYVQSSDAITPTRRDAKVPSTAKRKRIYMLDISTSSDDEITEVKNMPDSSGITGRVIPKKVTRDALNPDPLTSAAAASKAVSSHSSLSTLKTVHESPTLNVSNRVMPGKRCSAVNPGPSTSAASSDTVLLHSSSPPKISRSDLPASPTSIEMANFRPAILVNSQEMASGQEIISNLNVRHNARVAIAKLNHCDYIISNRMAVERKTFSDVANSALRRPLLLRIRDMISLFDRPCLIIESDRVKPMEKPRLFFRTRYFDNTLACIAQTPVKILFSQSQEATAKILVDLCRREFRKGSAIDVPLEVDENKAKHLKFYSTLPNVSHVICLNFCANFVSIMEFLNSSVAELEEKGKISRSRAELIHRYLRHEVSSDI